MRNRTPVPARERPPLPEFTPVPRKPRHDGWTPERQKAFIAALADTGASVAVPGRHPPPAAPGWLTANATPPPSAA